MILNNIHLYIGDCVLIGGKSGSGKSTILHKILNNNYSASNNTLLNNIEIVRYFADECISILLQNPNDQIVLKYVIEQIGLSLENTAFSIDEIYNKISEYANLFDVYHLLHQDISLLSFGQKQIINIIATLIANKIVVLLDEPTAFLDAYARINFINNLQLEVNSKRKLFIIVEHNIQYIHKLINRFLFIQGDQLLELSVDLLPQYYYGLSYDTNNALGMMYNQSNNQQQPYNQHNQSSNQHFIINQYAYFSLGSEYQHTYKANFNLDYETSSNAKPNTVNSNNNRLLIVDHYQFLDNSIINLALNYGEVIIISGKNGIGKSHLLEVIAKYQLNQINSTKKQTKNIPNKFTDSNKQGQQNQENDVKILFCGKNIIEYDQKTYYSMVGLLLQNPKLHFMHDTIAEELNLWNYKSKHLHLLSNQQDNIEGKNCIKQIVSELNLLHLLDRNPFAVSEGEQRLISFISVITQNKQLYLLDEPAFGLDLNARMQVAKIIINKAAKDCSSFIIISHDSDFNQYFMQ